MVECVGLSQETQGIGEDDFSFGHELILDPALVSIPVDELLADHFVLGLNGLG